MSGFINSNKKVLSESLRNLITLGIPIIIFADTVLKVRFDSLDVFLLSSYAVFLSIYLLEVFFYEYFLFHDLHVLKNNLIDTMLLITMYFSIRQFSIESANATKCLLWLSVFLGSLIVWEIYTMFLGYKKRYFQANIKSLELSSMVRLLSECLQYKVNKQGIDHWDEYRYWLIVDVLLFVNVFLSFLFLNYNIQNKFVQFFNELVPYLIAMVGLYVGILNIYRYRILTSGVLNRQ